MCRSRSVGGVPWIAVVVVDVEVQVQVEVDVGVDVDVEVVVDVCLPVLFVSGGIQRGQILT